MVSPNPFLDPAFGYSEGYRHHVGSQLFTITQNLRRWVAPVEMSIPGHKIH